MGWLKKITKTVGKAVGDVVKNPVGLGSILGTIALGPGLGTTLGAGAGAVASAAGGTPEVPAPPVPVAGGPEDELRKKQSDLIDTYIKSIEDQKGVDKKQADILAVSSGIYDPIYDDAGNLIDTKLNKDSLDNLRKSVTTQTQVSDLQLEYLQDQLQFAKDIAPAQAELLKEQINTQLETSKAAAGISEITRLQLDRFQKALNGELPVSEATKQQKEQDFKLFKEAQARAGNTITGDSVETASADSTPGIQSLENFRKTYALREDEEKRGIVNQGLTGVYGLPSGSPNFVSPGSGGTSQNPILGLTGTAATTFGPGATASGYGTASQLAGGAQQPYQADRGLLFQTNLQNAANRAQARSDLFGLVGNVVGLGGSLAMAA